MESYYSYSLPQSYLNSVPFNTAYTMYPYDGNVPSSTASLPTSTSPPPAALTSPINQYFAHDIPVTPPMDHWSGSESSGSSSPRTFESKIASETMMKITSTSSPPPHSTEEDATNRRRAQNRAAQRAFRARKEKHAKELEQQLHNLQEKYQSLQTSHSQLSVAYSKLRESVEVLTSAASASPTTTSTISPSAQGVMNGGVGSPEVLRNLLNILYGEIKVEPGLEQF